MKAPRTSTPPAHQPPAPADKPARITRRGEAKRAAILDTAAALFLARGYDGVSLDEIVKVCGGSKTNVYSYFGGKDGLFTAVVEALCDRFVASVETLEPSRSSTADGLRDLALRSLESLLEESHLAFLRLVVAEARRFPEAGRAWYARGPMATCQYIAAYLSRQQAAGVKLNAAPAGAAQLFHSMVIAGILHRTLATGERPNAAQIDSLVTAAIDLIVARP